MIPRIILIIAAIAFFASNALAAEYTIKGGWVKYTAKVNMIKMMSNDTTLETITGTNASASGRVTAHNGNVVGRLTIAANGFKTDKEKRDVHVTQLLKATDYPEIIFELDNLAIPDAELKKLLAQESFTKTLKGKLTVAGVTRSYDFEVRVTRLKDKTYTLTTQRYVKFSDFNIKAPSMPLLTTDEQILITGEMTVEQK